MEQLISHIKTEAKEVYNNKIDLLKEINHVKTISFNSNEIEKINTEEDFNSFIEQKKFLIKRMSSYVYFFELENDNIVDEIQDKLLKARNDLSVYRNYTQINSNCLKTSNILYVGSKKTDFKVRLKQHLGLLSKSTGALHLKYWFPKDLLLKFHYIEIPDKSMTYDIESLLRKELNPILGQK